MVTDAFVFKMRDTLSLHVYKDQSRMYPTCLVHSHGKNPSALFLTRGVYKKSREKVHLILFSRFCEYQHALRQSKTAEVVGLGRSRISLDRTHVTFHDLVITAIALGMQSRE